MFERVLKGIIGVFGLLFGYSLIAFASTKLEVLKIQNTGLVNFLIYLGVSLFFGIIFLSMSSKIIKKVKKIIELLETELQKFSVYDIIVSSIGLIIGLLIAYLISNPIYNWRIPYVNMVVPVIIYILLGYLGLTIPYKKKEDIYKFFLGIRKISKETDDKIAEIKEEEKAKSQYPKVLDTSVIIDGRILDICKTGFIEGPLVIPEFVLGELQHIADSSDSLKRTRGRRGLDILNEIQKTLDIEVIIYDGKFEDIKEVDSKLLKLTKLLDGKIITNDYNLNKVAEVQGILVLNINDLSNAVKPIVLPGEEMQIQVVKDGKEANQGLAYLDDGTMIVVESGKKYIGDNITVTVTSVLQTSAGRMIFAKPTRVAM